MSAGRIASDASGLKDSLENLFNWIENNPGTALQLATIFIPGAPELEALQFIHSAEVIEAGENFASLSKLSSDELVESLAPGAENPLLVSPDGRIFDGNTRAYNLNSRGMDTGAAPTSF